MSFALRKLWLALSFNPLALQKRHIDLALQSAASQMLLRASGAKKTAEEVFVASSAVPAHRLLNIGSWEVQLLPGQLPAPLLWPLARQHRATPRVRSQQKTACANVLKAQFKLL